MPWLILGAAPLLACWPLLLGFSVDPLNLVANLLTAGRPGVLPGTFTLDLNVGVTTQALGRLAAEQWLSGVVPWWNAFSGIGMPLAGEMQASALFLPFVLLLHFDNGPLLLKLAMQVVAGLACYGLLRRLAVSRLAATVGGLLFELSATFAWLGHGPIMPVAFLPLFLLGIEHARTGGYRTIAVAVAFSLYAGFPETAYLDGLLALGWAAWRCAGATDRWRFAGRVTLGGALGLALAAPALWSFGHFLLHGTAENHAVLASAFDALPPPMPDGLAAVWLYPYLYGPLFAFADPAGALGDLSQYLGGAFGVLPVLLAVLGALGTPQRALRLILAGWVVVGVGGVAGLPVLGHVIYALPLLRQTLVARYAMPSWDFAVIVLAVLAIDDWRRGEVGRRRTGLAIALTAAVAVASVAMAAGLVRATAAANPGYWAWPAGAVAWGCAVCIGAVWLVAAPPTRRRAGGRAGGLAVLLTLDAAVVFCLPMLSGTRDAVIDRPAIAFLHDHAGLQRFYALGPYRPNYGAFFQTAQINHEYLPLPSNWVAHVHAALDPSASVIMFRGDEPPPPPGVAGHAAEMVSRLDSYAALGVRYVVTRSGEDPFVNGFSAPAGDSPGVVTAFAAGQTLQGNAQAPRDGAGRITGLGLKLGTYLGQSDGRLSAELCAASACSHGTLDMAQAVDNAQAIIGLQPPLDVGPGETLRWRIAHDGGDHPVAVWLQGDAPRVAFLRQGVSPPRVWRDGLMDIYELPGAAPYFEAIGGPCRLAVQSRTRLAAECDAPARLVRRELFFSGWRAWTDEAPAAIAPFGDVMQQIALPAGRSHVRFGYAPPYAGLCWALAGMAALGLVSFRRRRVFAGQPRSA